uniref:Large ribosomal subunit protein bL35c n=1 Tax=Boldia erythrosiphon TaxID=74908 RepID=A0A1Y9TLT6_9RHOD|nr:50S ribosomal protein L35 [Boldia erythrosiphon]ARO90577.1 50S ribosomal protein L35 [Boldia erythrosiphon]
MPKLKTKKSISKRFKIISTHKILRRRAGKNHFLQKKSSNRKLSLSRNVLITKKYAKTILFTTLFI